MTARPQDVALLPLPEEDGDLPRSGWWNGAPREGSDPCWLRESVESYARANVAAALASAQAREEELRVALTLEKAGAEHERIRMTCRIERLEEALRDGLSGLNGLFASGDYPLTDEVVEIGLAIIGDMQAALSTNAATQTGERNG